MNTHKGREIVKSDVLVNWRFDNRSKTLAATQSGGQKRTVHSDVKALHATKV